MFYPFKYNNHDFFFSIKQNIISITVNGYCLTYDEDEVLSQKINNNLLIRGEYELQEKASIEFEEIKVLMLEALLKFKKVRALL